MLSPKQPTPTDGNYRNRQVSHSEIRTESRSLADALPDLLIEASNIANTIAFGWHGRRRAGPGETFWQFRPFNQGEPVKRVDWRRSARDDHLYVRELEWEAAHTVWLWTDLSDSMNFQSKLSTTSKRDRALVLMLGLAELLARGGEKIGIPSVMHPIANRQSAERLAEALMHSGDLPPLPNSQSIKRFSDVVVIADFLDPFKDINNWLETVANTGARGHFVQVLDPVEETFPFDGRTEFEDPETGVKMVTGRAQDWKAAYHNKLTRHQEDLRTITLNAGWSYLIHHTDRPAVEPLLALHSLLSRNDSVFGSASGVR